MPIEIRKKNPITHSLKVAIGTILIFVVLGLYLKLDDKSKNIADTKSKASLITELNSTDRSYPPVIRLSVDDPKYEKNWVRAFQLTYGGTSEVSVEHGRIDLTIDNYAIEVDFIDKWQEGVGQALNYAKSSGLKPLLAIIIWRDKSLEESEDKVKYIYELTNNQGIRLLVLTNK